MQLHLKQRKSVLLTLLVICSACGGGGENQGESDGIAQNSAVDTNPLSEQNPDTVTVSQIINSTYQSDQSNPPAPDNHASNQSVVLPQFPNRVTQLDFTDNNPGTVLPSIDQTQENPQFGNKITRISSSEKFQVGDNTFTHDYSKRQAWNSNETLLIVGDKLLSADEFNILKEQIPISTARNWSNIHANYLYGFKFTGEVLNEFGYHDFFTDQFTLIKKFDRFDNCTLGQGEGNISNDDRYALFTCSKNNGPITMISFDILNSAILGERVAEPDMNWAGFSQSGSYILVGNSGAQTDTRNLTRYNPDLSNPFILSNKFHHGDLGIDVYGADVFTMIGATHISYIRLSDKFKVTFPISSNENPTSFGHVSCRNVNRPGWCYVSTYHEFRLAAVQLDFDGTSVEFADQDGEFSVNGVAVVEPWGVHRSTASDYEKQPRVSVSPSGSQIVFSSDWYASSEANAFVIAAPNN